MEIKEQLETINKVSRTELSEALGISRQALHQRIKKQVYIDEMYDVAIDILNNVEYNHEKTKEESLKEENKYLKNIILELRNDRDKLEAENKKLKEEIKGNLEYKELKQSYEQLKQRYYHQNDESIMLKASKPIQRKCM